MVDFEKLNRQTNDYNNKNVNRFNPAAPNTTSKSYLNYMNNQTYKKNNGVYSKYYF